MINVNGEKKKVAGIIVECNPFHKGHIRLIKECKKNADIVVAVMSGNFVQRGEPAVYSKEKRTENLLAAGVDLVIELPLFATLSSAKYFARAGVSILDSLGFVDFIMFGSKVADVEKLSGLADLDDNIVKSELKTGRSYPYAISKAMGVTLTSNDVLGLEYIRAINELKSKIKVMTIERKDDLPTASELREKIKKKVTCNDFSEILNYKLLYAKVMADNKKENVLDEIYLMTDDIRNAILKLEEGARTARPYGEGARIARPYEKKMSFDEMAMKLNTKNRTLANIKRIFFNIILDITKDDVKESGLAELAHTKSGFTAPTFIRILGVGEDSKHLLKYIRIPYLISFAPSSYRSFVEKFKKSKAVKKNKSGGFTLAPMIKKTILADKLFEIVGSHSSPLRV